MPDFMLIPEKVRGKIRCFKSTKTVVLVTFFFLPSILLCVLHFSTDYAQAESKNLYATLGLGSQDISSKGNDFISDASGSRIGFTIGYFLGERFSLEFRDVAHRASPDFFFPVWTKINGVEAEVESDNLSLGVKTYLLPPEKKKWEPWVGLYLSKLNISVREIPITSPGPINYDYSALGPSLSVGFDVGVGRVSRNEKMFLQAALTYSQMEGDQEFKAGPDLQNVKSEILEFTISFGVY